jgi:hypothetical protein
MEDEMAAGDEQGVEVENERRNEIDRMDGAEQGAERVQEEVSRKASCGRNDGRRELKDMTKGKKKQRERRLK